MSEVKRYYVGKYGLVEGEALGRLGVVLGADFDRVTAERDALRGDLAQQKRYVEINANSAHGKHKEAMQYRAERDALQVRLTAADERNDNRDSEIFAQVQSALRRSFSLGQIYWQQADSDSTCQQNKSDQTMGVQEQHILNVLKSLGVALKPAGRTNTSGKAHCPHDGICHTSDEMCAEARARIASLKPAEGGGDGRI